MNFTAEQQAFIDASFNKRFSEIQAKAEAKRVEDLSTVEAKYSTQIAAKDAELIEAKKASSGSRAGNEDLTALKERLASLEADKVRSRELNKQSQLLTVASELNAINAEQVAVLVSPHIRVDDEGDFFILTSKGETRFGVDGRPTQIKDFVLEFLQANPHMAKASGLTGTGSHGANGGKFLD